MADSSDAFTGTWQLVPELCHYQDGTPPLAATYAIALKDGIASFTLGWTDSHGKSHQISYGGPADASVIPFRGGHVNEMSFNRVDDHILESSSYSDGREVAYSRRLASADGTLLSVMLVNRHDGDIATRNFQVYRRITT